MEQIARYKPGDNVAGFAVTAVLAGRFVKIVAGKTSQGDYSIGHCTAGARAFGVAEQDSAAATEPAHSVERRINCTRRGSIARVLAAVDIPAGSIIASDGTGKAAIANGTTDVELGQAVSTADVDTGQYVEVDLF